MAFTFAPSKDWVKNINDFMADYDKFSNGYTDVSAGDENVKRWGQKIYDKTTITAMNGCAVATAGIQQYTWNSQPVNFIWFNVNLGSNSIGINQSLDILKLPVGSGMAVANLRAGVAGFVDGTISSNGTLSITNISVNNAKDFVRGSLIFV